MMIPKCIENYLIKAFQSAEEEQREATELQMVSGHTVSELKQLFAAGYFLSPPCMMLRCRYYRKTSPECLRCRRNSSLKDFFNEI